MQEWCEKSFIQFKRIKDVEFLRAELLRRLEAKFITIPEQPNRMRDKSIDSLLLRIAICGAFYPYYFLQQPMQPKEVERILYNKNPCNTIQLAGVPPKFGLLYAEQLRQYLEPCGSKCTIEFTEDKALITFIDDINPLKEAEEIQHFIFNEGDYDNLRANETAVKTAGKIEFFFAIL